MTTIYLAGPIQHADDADSWRDRLLARDLDGIELVDPRDNNPHYESDAPTAPSVFEHDVAAVHDADAVIAKLPLETVTRGTAIEMWEASRHGDTYVVGVIDAPADAYSPAVRLAADSFDWSPIGAIATIDVALGADAGRECLRCGYVTFNDEIDRDEPPDVCPECGRDLP